MQNLKPYLQLVTPQTDLPPGCGLEDVKLYLGITNALDDTRLTALIRAAVDEIENETGLKLTSEVYKLNLNGFPNLSNYIVNNMLYYQDFFLYYNRYAKKRIYLPHPPLLSESVSVHYYDENNQLQAWGTDQYYVGSPETEPGFIEPVGDYPTAYDRPDSVQVTFTTQGDVLPARVSLVVCAMVSFWNENREGQGSCPAIDRLIDNLKGARYV